MAALSDTDARTLVERLREATELLEAIAADRTMLAGVTDGERARLLQAVALVYHPDRVERRRMSRITAKQRKAARERLVAGRPTRTLTPLSFRFSACAWPCDP